MEYDLGLLAYRITVQDDGAIFIQRQATNNEDRMIWEAHQPEDDERKAVAQAVLQDFQDARWARRLDEDFVKEFLEGFPKERAEIVIEPGDLQGWLEELGINLKSVPDPSPGQNGGS